MEAVTSGKMHEIEDAAIKAGVSRLIMMENAGKSVSDLVNNLCKVSGRRRVLVVAGTGNNGGDAFVAARHLLYHGLDVDVALVGSKKKITSPEAKVNWKILRKTNGVRINVIEELNELKTLENMIVASDVIIIGLFGTGFKGIPRQLHMRTINFINSIKSATKVSVDIPSGMGADSGVCDHSVISDYTVTMHAPKKGMLKSRESRNACGEIIIADIGIPFV